MGFRLRANHKKNEINANVDPAERDRQLTIIKRQRICFENRGFPVISVDGKAKELVGGSASKLGNDYQLFLNDANHQRFVSHGSSRADEIRKRQTDI
jgi:hypothetical protein